MDISLALEVLRHAPPEVLQNHRQEAIEAFRDIEARIRELDFPESDSSIPAFTAVANGSGSHEAGTAASTQLPSSVEQPTSTVQDKIKPSHSMNLLTALNKTASWVWKSTKRRPNEVLGIKRPRPCDRRLADVRRIEGESQAEPKYKLLRVLAQRSLVLQGEKSGYLDIENYCKVASSRGQDKAKKGRGGTIALFVREELEIEKEDQALAIQAISGGIKQLVTERLLRERFEKTGQCGSASGISAFTALAVRPFRYLKHEEIPEFLDCLLMPDSMDLSALMDEPRMENSLPVSIKEVIQKSSEWLDEIQVYYNTLLDIREDFDSREDFDKQQLNERARKRQPSSPDPDEAGSHPTTSPQESPDSFNGVLEHPGSNFSESPSSTGLESSLFVGSPSQRRFPLAMSQIKDNQRSDSAGTTSEQMFSPSCTANSVGESPFSPLSSSENPSNIEKARLDIVSSEFSQHGTSQLHDPSIQPYTGASDTRIPYDPWLNVHVTSQLNDLPLAPYADTSDTLPYDPWLNVHVTSQLNDLPLAPYADTSDTRIPYDPWLNVHVTSQLNDPPLAPNADTDNTQIPSDFSQHGTPQPHDPSAQPYTGTCDTQIPYDPWLNVHVTSQLNDPPLAPYADTNDAQIPSNNWPNTDATFRLNGPSVAPYTSTNRTQVLFDSSQQVPSQRAVYQHPARSTLPLYTTPSYMKAHLCVLAELFQLFFVP
ncbi:uncharacterized protein N7487_008628 [Penicillium crustosum]|uniref:uncharacterized protein n=1 Tax=Penicillium crustosum TaxID=36656 RepID=UPI002399DA29|nr:uncharacterized protein N7487_008628 [Penicillium crustosum]KAJ5402732.1 hypothetical protein N7487_008628 [Penicillium crustosum]